MGGYTWAYVFVTAPVVRQEVPCWRMPRLTVVGCGGQGGSVRTPGLYRL